MLRPVVVKVALLAQEREICRGVVRAVPIQVCDGADAQDEFPGRLRPLAVFERPPATVLHAPDFEKVGSLAALAAVPVSMADELAQEWPLGIVIGVVDWHFTLVLSGDSRQDVVSLPLTIAENFRQSLHPITSFRVPPRMEM